MGYYANLANNTPNALQSLLEAATFQMTDEMRNPGKFYITFIQTIEMDAVMWMHIRQYFQSRHRRNHELASRHGGLGLVR
ncbi:hypothetical protein N7501_010671 [Penicillium viridicatum]|nr:hypothetical protein N7501_010671 [Penicillium viridicatum]